jgi:rare lipoprotein A
VQVEVTKRGGVDARMNQVSFLRNCVLQFTCTLIMTGCVTSRNYGKEASQAAEKKYVYVGTGKASFYAPHFKNRKTANGEYYRPEAYTAAHLTLPFGTLLVVRKKSSGRFVIVRVNDRGPHIPGRVVDLSYSAAQKLGLIRAGVANVDLYVVPKNSPLYSQL